MSLLLFIFFTEVTFPDGDLNGAENGSLPNHAAERSKLSFNDTEGRGHKINASALFPRNLPNFSYQCGLVN